MSRFYYLLIVLLLAACSPAPAAATLQPTIVQMPTSLPAADTPLPTAAASQQPTTVPTRVQVQDSTTIPPTATIAAPTVLGDYLINPSIVSFDSFDTLGDWRTSGPQAGLISNGKFIITGQAGGLSSLTKNTRLAEGQGVLFDFEYNPHAQFEFNFESGEPKANTYRKLSVTAAGSPLAALTQGKNSLGTIRLTGNFVTKPGSWYSFMAGIGTKGNFVAVIWDKNNPSNLVKFQKNLADPWDNLAWQFTANVADKYMKLSLDNFSVINFEDVK
ncbi:MAG: hypothetical protein P4L50_27290 [Anaerolineaceae bacterium]|nr:hypothetical protein [Anaerolineaceae bacterium]